MVDDTIQVSCSRCRTKFRDKIGRVRSGYSRQCPSCECVLFFEEGSSNKNIQQALREADRMRKALRKEEMEKAASRAAAAAVEQTGEDETGIAPTRFGRRVERRGPAAGRRWS